MKLFDEPRNRLAKACENYFVGKTVHSLTIAILETNLKDSQFMARIKQRGVIEFSRAGAGNQLHELALLLMANPSEFDVVMKVLAFECRLKIKPQDKPRGKVRFVS